MGLYDIVWKLSIPDGGLRPLADMFRSCVGRMRIQAFAREANLIYRNKEIWDRVGISDWRLERMKK